MDGDSLSLGETERALADLRRSNRWLLGHRPVLRALLPHLARARDAGQSGQSGRQILLDLGTGSGDVAAAVVKAARRRGVALQILGIDRKLRHLALARRRHPEQWHVVASADALPFAENAVSWSLSTLFFHHFGAAGNRRILREMHRVTRELVAVIDLRQSALLRRLIAPLLWILGTGKVALEDGVISARHAWNVEQVRMLVTSLGLLPVELRRRFPFRFSLLFPGVKNLPKDP